MTGLKIYNCSKCGKKATLTEEEVRQGKPECCKQVMEPLDLPACESSATAEHSRLNAPDEPCNDGRAGKK